MYGRSRGLRVFEKSYISNEIYDKLHRLWKHRKSFAKYLSPIWSSLRYEYINDEKIQFFLIAAYIQG